MKKARSVQSITFRDWVPEEERWAKVKYDLPLDFQCDGPRKTKDGAAVTLRYFGVSCVLRHREKGTVECEAGWVRTTSGRIRTGTRSLCEAMDWACPRLEDAHLRYLDRGGRSDDDDPEATGSLYLSEAVQLLRAKGLVPGKKGDKTYRQYDLVLDLALAVWDDNPRLDRIGTEHLLTMYRARATSEGGENEDLPAFKWPANLSHRRPVGRVKPLTVQKNLEDLKHVLGQLIGQTDWRGRPFLTARPLDGLKFGRHRRARGDVAGHDRYPWVLRCTDAAVEVFRTVGHVIWERKRPRPEASLELRDRTEKWPNLVPGLLRMMLVLQFGHPTRPRSIRGLRRDDVARTRPELTRRIRSLKLVEDDEPVPLDWVDAWPHGGIAYRCGHSKRASERMVPLTEDMAIEADRYLEMRDKWLRHLGVESPWLFPSPRDPSQPISERDAARLLDLAEELARERCAEAGLDPEEIVPHYSGTLWYAYRRYWKTNRNALGWSGKREAAYVGDWTTKVGDVADVRYARLDPHLILGVVDGVPYEEALPEDAEARYRRAARIRPDEDQDAPKPPSRATEAEDRPHPSEASGHHLRQGPSR
jgi:hypothetical protein